MKDKQIILEKKFFHELRGVCREQLLSYPIRPKKTIKQQIKSVVKKFLLRDNSKIDKFFWPNSLLAIALELSYKNLNDKNDLDCLVSYYDKWIGNGLSINNLDNTMNGYSMVYVYEETNELKYKKALDVLTSYLINHPKDKNGSLPYRRDSDLNILVDSLGMICPFLCRYGKLTNNSELIDLAVLQLVNFLEYGLDKDKYLPYHAYNAESYIKLGIVGWGRAVGWLLIGLVDSLEYIDSNNSYYNLLAESLNKIIVNVIKFQRYDGYFSWQLEAVEGHVDSSSTSMISYAIRKAINLGLIDNSFKYNTDLALSALYNSIEDGNVLDCSAECMGLSMYPQRYGSFPWAQGPTTALLAISIKQN